MGRLQQALPELLSKGGGPEAVLAYLSRYTHRVAIANSRLIALDESGVTFKWKDYRAKGRERAKVMKLAVDELIRRFLIHVLPDGSVASVTMVSSPTAGAPRTSPENAAFSIKDLKTRWVKPRIKFRCAPQKASVPHFR